MRVWVASTPSTLFSRPAMVSCRSSWRRTRTMATRSTSPATRVHLAHPVQVGERLGDLGDAVDGGVHQDDRGDHAAEPSAGADRGRGAGWARCQDRRSAGGVPWACSAAVGAAATGLCGGWCGRSGSPAPRPRVGRRHGAPVEATATGAAAGGEWWVPPGAGTGRAADGGAGPRRLLAGAVRPVAGGRGGRRPRRAAASSCGTSTTRPPTRRGRPRCATSPLAYDHLRGGRFADRVDPARTAVVGHSRRRAPRAVAGLAQGAGCRPGAAGGAAAAPGRRRGRRWPSPQAPVAALADGVAARARRRSGRRPARRQPGAGAGPLRAWPTRWPCCRPGCRTVLVHGTATTSCR